MARETCEILRHVRITIGRTKSNRRNYSDKKVLLDSSEANVHCEAAMTSNSTTDKRRKTFGRRLRDERRKMGMSQGELATYLTKRKFPTSGSNVGAWERGEYGPRDPKIVSTIDDLLQAGGRLRDAFGILEEEELARRRLAELVAALEREVASAKAQRGVDTPADPKATPPSLSNQIVDLYEQIEFLWDTIGTLVDALRGAGVALPNEWFEPSAPEGIIRLDTERRARQMLTQIEVEERARAVNQALRQAAITGNPGDPLDDRTEIVPTGDVPEEPE